MIRTLIVAPYASLRAELESALADAEDCTVVGAASGSDDMESLLIDLHTDIVVMAFNNEEEESEEQEERKRLLALASQYELGVVLLDDLPKSIRQMAASEVAAWAVMRNDTDSQQLAASIRAVAAGLVVVDRALIGLLAIPKVPSVMVTPSTPSISSLNMGNLNVDNSALIPASNSRVASEDSSLPFEKLTAREREVLQLVAQGLANKQIGGRLSISLHTVKFHVASILAKFGAMSRTEAVTLGARRGLVTL